MRTLDLAGKLPPDDSNDLVWLALILYLVAFAFFPIAIRAL
jgi:hypothetical protein